MTNTQGRYVDVLAEETKEAAAQAGLSNGYRPELAAGEEDDEE